MGSGSILEGSKYLLIFLSFAGYMIMRCSRVLPVFVLGVFVLGFCAGWVVDRLWETVSTHLSPLFCRTLNKALL